MTYEKLETIIKMYNYPYANRLHSLSTIGPIFTTTGRK